MSAPQLSLQTLDRAVAVLRVLGAGGELGCRLVDVQRQVNLAKPTAHRLLAALTAHGLVVQDAATRCYRLGDELAVLGWSVMARTYELRDLCQPAMDRLAEKTGDTVLMVVRSGHDTICVERKTGSFPIKALTVEIGTRRPLGVGAGGIAILARLPDAEAISESVRVRLQPFPTSEEAIRQAVRRARVSGYALSDGRVAVGVRGIAVALSDRRGAPVAGLGVAATRDRIAGDRLQWIVSLLEEERRWVESQIRSHDPVAEITAGALRKGRARR
jgi:DNA-binding IclR family transcriptional regulator